MPTTTRATCAHCGTPFTPKEEEAYCCHGCHYVAQLLEDNDLTRFYELKGSKAVPPVGSKAFREVETATLEAVLREAEARSEKPVVSAKFGVEGLSCIGCVWLIEAIFKRQEGAANARIDARSGEVELSWQRGHFDLAEFARVVQQIGYKLTLYRKDASGPRESRQITYRIGLCGFFLLNTMLFTLPGYLGMGGEFFLAPLFNMLGALFATLSLAVGGSYFIQRAWQAARNHVLHIDLPIAAGLVVAYLGSLIGWASGYIDLIYFDFVATFVFLMLVGRWLQEVALEKNRNHLQRQQAGPREVTVIGGALDGKRIAAEDVTEGLEYSVAPYEINPVAADPLDASGTLSLEWINGEAEPVVWPQERIAPAGAINVGLQALRFRAREAWPDSLLAKLLERPEDSFRDSRLQAVLKYYILIVIATGLLGGMAWLATTGDPLKSTQVLISVLIVSCPCALGVALPMCEEFATARLRRVGLFIKNEQIWERLRRIRTVVFDKTGTLTMDVPRLTNPAAVRELDPLAAQALHRLINHNPHPVARSLREAVLAEYPGLGRNRQEACSPVKESIGQGVSWTDEGGNEWSLGKPSFKQLKTDQPITGKPAGHSLLCQNGLIVAEFYFAEDVRDDAREVIRHLRRQNLDTSILSGDAASRVENIAAQLGLNPQEAKASCTPQDKAEWIETHAKGRALMIGDGANDSLAFDAAICRGTPVVDKSILEASADFFFFGRSLRCLPELFQTAQRRRQTVAVIFTAAVVYNLAAVGLCLAGMMHPLLAAIVMPLSSVATLAMAWAGLGQPLNENSAYRKKFENLAPAGC
ncbi:MAG: heavy metal translocating P-type ATPase [Opitutales bacterium]